MIGRRWALVALLVTTSSVASAHPMEFGVMSLEERGDGRFELELRFSGGEDAPRSGAPWLDEGCTLEQAIDVPLDYGVHVRGLLACRDGLVGKRIGVVGLEDSPIEVPLTIRRRDGDVETALLTSDAPRHRVATRPDRAAIFVDYVRLGVEHITMGIDHLLLVLGLLLATRTTRSVLVTITSFTVGHSVTLALASLDVVRVPVPPVEACIALSLVLLAAELVRTDRARTTSPAWLAIVFGLLHGLGFASALSEVGLPHHAIGLALFGFNLGVELGQVAFVGVALATSRLAERVLTGGAVESIRRRLPELVGVVATYFLLERLVALG